LLPQKGQGLEDLIIPRKIGSEKID
jgi:hypothetical protein